MADIKNITIDGTTYDLKDDKARNDITDLKEDIKDNYAKNDGYYDGMTVGNAEQLTSNIYEEDNTPYNFRTSGGSIDIGDRETDMLVGGTVAWNQLVKNGDFNGTANWSWNTDWVNFSAANNIASISTVNVSTELDYVHQIVQPVPIPVNHKVLILAEFKPAHTHRMGTFIIRDYNVPDGVNLSKYIAAEEGKWNPYYAIFNTVSGASIFQVQCNMRESAGYSVGDVDQVRNVQFFDLTAMFGSTVADYIYSLEQATAGAGVAWFRKLFPKPYYAYNAGELMSVQAASHDMVGFNMLDIASYYDSSIFTLANGKLINSYTDTRTSFAPSVQVYNNNTYVDILATPIWTGTGVKYITFTAKDIEGNILRIKHNGATQDLKIADVPYDLFVKGAVYCLSVNLESNNPTSAGGLVINDICINLHWDGERDGEYEAYEKHSYALDGTLTLRGIPKLDSSNNLYYDGDTYESDGTVTRKYGYKRFTNGEPSTIIYSVTVGTDKTRVVCNGDALPNAKSGAYLSFRSNAFVYDYNSNPDIGQGAINNGFLIFGAPATVTTKEEAVAYLANRNTEFVYELATPTTETADTYTNPQIVNDFGTEEYVDYAVSQGDRDVAIPVGHETQYMANLKAKLETAPCSPEGAGDYIVRQTNGENEYVPLASNATIQDIIARLEALEGGGE